MKVQVTPKAKKAEELLHQACQRCEEWSTHDECENSDNCPVYGLYKLASGLKKIIYKQDVWATPPSPRPEMI
jgi:hypothetical protein